MGKRLKNGDKLTEEERKQKEAIERYNSAVNKTNNFHLEEKKAAFDNLLALVQKELEKEKPKPKPKTKAKPKPPPNPLPPPGPMLPPLPPPDGGGLNPLNLLPFLLMELNLAIQNNDQAKIIQIKKMISDIQQQQQQIQQQQQQILPSPPPPLKAPAKDKG